MITKIECEICGDEWEKDSDENMLVENYENIEGTKRCCGCYEEFGATRFADQ